MKLLHFLTLLTFLTISLFAKTHEGKFKYTTYENAFTTDIEVKYKIWTLYGEPVVNTVARYKIVNGSVSIDGHSYNLSEFPKTVMEKVRLYKLELQVPFEPTYSTGKIVYIDIDMGAMGNAGEWSFNTPASPKWSKWIYHANYLSKEEAIKAYKGFKKLEFYETGEYTKNIKYDITALKRYLSEQKLEQEKQRLKKEYMAKTEGLKKEIEKLYDIDKKNTSCLQKRYGDEDLYQVMKRLQKGKDKEELALFMKVLEESDKLALKVKPLREKIKLISEKHEKIEKKFEDEYSYALLEIDEELKKINYLIDEKRKELENRELPQKINNSLDGKWYRKKDNRLLIFKDDYAYYPDGSKDKWKGHDTKYRNIKYLTNNKWSCESEFYLKGRGFFWDGIYIYKIDNNNLKAIDFKNKITYWSR